MKNPPRALADGVLCPLDIADRRSPHAAAQRIFAAAIETLDASAALSIRRERDWPRHYASHQDRIRDLAGLDPANGLHMARHALAAAEGTFHFVRGGVELPLAAALETHSSGALLHTGTAGGSGRTPAGPLGLRVASEPFLRSLDGRVFVLLGVLAQAELAAHLLEQGALVVATDQPDARRWSVLIQTASACPGRLLFPLRSPAMPGLSVRGLATAAGADLRSDAPEIRAWVTGQLRAQQGPVAFGWAAEGSDVRAGARAAALDAILQTVLRERAGVPDCVLPVLALDGSSPHAALANCLLAWRRELSIADGLRPAAVEKINWGRKTRYPLQGAPSRVSPHSGSQNVRSRQLLSEGIS